MKKTIVGIVVVLLLILGVGIYASAASHKEELFWGINGERISVYTSIDSKNGGDNTESGDVKAGDIIELEGLKEIVIGVSKDGRYITMPLEDYAKQNN